MANRDSSSVGNPAWRRAARKLAPIAASGSAVLIAVGLIGQALRDGSVATALLMYIPLPIVGAAAVILDAARNGRSIPWFRPGLSVLGLVAIFWSAGTKMGSGSSEERRPGDREITVLHWNVQWGGGLFRGPRTWAAQREAMVRRKPDLIVLSEAPPGGWIDRLVHEIGPRLARDLPLVAARLRHRPHLARN
jgi:hypothetical protein